MINELYIVTCHLYNDFNHDGIDYTCFNCGIFTDKNEAESLCNSLKQNCDIDWKKFIDKYAEGIEMMSSEWLKDPIFKFDIVEVKQMPFFFGTNESKFVVLGEAIYLD